MRFMETAGLCVNELTNPGSINENGFPVNKGLRITLELLGILEVGALCTATFIQEMWLLTRERSSFLRP